MESFKQKIDKTNIVNFNLSEYLQKSLDSDNKDLCKGWEYLKQNLTKPLREILNDFDYWNKKYNAEKVKEILSYYLIKYAEKYNLNQGLLNQLGSFVYVWNDIKRDCEEHEQEEKLRKELTERGFKEQDVIKRGIDLTEEIKGLDGLKVICVMDISKIGLLGSFDETKEIEGRFAYSKHNKGLMLIPKRCRTKGYLIRNRFYYKVRS